MVSVSKVAGLGFAAASIAVLTFALLSGITEDGQRVNRVILEVVYDGSFNVTVIMNGQVSIQSTYGLVKTTLVRLSEGKGEISASVEKLDPGNGTLYVDFKTVDREVLASDSKVSPWEQLVYHSHCRANF